MFEYIKGTIDSIFPGSIVIDNNGIGYKIYVAIRSLKLSVKQYITSR